MKQCQKCKANLADDALFCTACGTKYGEEPKADESNSLFLKYSGYLDPEALFKVAWAKEKGIVKSEVPGEAETIYKMLALKGHQGSMFRYSMIQLEKDPPNTEEAVTWLRLAATQGHVESINYLKTSMPEVLEEPEKKQEEVSALPVHREGELTGEEVFAKMQHSVVEIYAADNKTAARSSGFLVSASGFVLTNAHAVLDSNGEPYSTLRVLFDGKAYEGKLVAVGSPADGVHDNLDLALLFAVGIKDSAAAELGDSASCRNGQKVYLIGNSLGSGTCITSGIISDAQRAMPGLSYPYVMTDAAANHGNSGGPLVSKAGNVVGVLVAGVQNAEGMNYAIPINIAKDFLAFVSENLHLPPHIAGELGGGDAPTTMSTKDKIFEGIRLAVDVLAFIFSMF